MKGARRCARRLNWPRSRSIPGRGPPCSRSSFKVRPTRRSWSPAPIKVVATSRPMAPKLRRPPPGRRGFQFLPFQRSNTPASTTAHPVACVHGNAGIRSGRASRRVVAASILLVVGDLDAVRRPMRRMSMPGTGYPDLQKPPEIPATDPAWPGGGCANSLERDERANACSVSRESPNMFEWPRKWGRMPPTASRRRGNGVPHRHAGGLCAQGHDQR